MKHDCPAPNTRDVQVPQCPLCGVPVPGKRGEPPDVAVGAHIDNQCTSDPARERRKKVNNYDNYSFELYGELNVMTLLSLSMPIFKILSGRIQCSTIILARAPVLNKNNSFPCVKIESTIIVLTIR